MAQLSLKGSKVLQAQLDGETIRAITGAMVAYEGEVTFKHAGMGGGGGFKAAVKRKMTGESLALMECTGRGLVYFAVDAQDVTVVELDNETMQVESQQLLALDGNLRTDVMFSGLRGATSGQGLFTTTVTGVGQAALLSAGGPPIALEVSPQHPLVVDPDAYVASRGQLNQTFVTDVSWKSVIGEGSGEAFSLRFDGTGVVYIQPEER
ncbi:AIM24 family protein [Rhodococcus antarcticus]|uniref:AIM24 family protein n=2 Tax=Rhodococcus antarcticus TaxID=2987751 RepID=A0ABY6P048_9NOCA|nr:AIM24 family protein [Rhodococcus antarcticus]UZJ24641.1 AIM24 family protein [Rhodococcus antarcticus]